MRAISAPSSGAHLRREEEDSLERGAHRYVSAVAPKLIWGLENEPLAPVLAVFDGRVVGFGAAFRSDVVRQGRRTPLDEVLLQVGRALKGG